MKNFFERLVNPITIDEPLFTQIIAAVFEKDHDLTRFIARKIFEEKGIKVDISDQMVLRIKDETPIIHGGKPDIIIEFLNKSHNYASVIFENKLNAVINNPINSYLNEVKERKKNGQFSILVLVSKRSARNDDELQDYISDNDFLYLNWHDIYSWIRNDFIKTSKSSWLVKEFLGYLKLMGIDMSGKFNFGEVGIGQYIPGLIGKFDKVLDESQVEHSIRQFSCQSKSALKDWKGSATYCKWVYIHPDTNYYLAAGFAFTKDIIWGQVKVTDFVNEVCPIVIFVGLGVEDSPNPELSKWVKTLLSRSKTKVPSSFVINDENSEFYLLSYKPLTELLEGDDHLGSCRIFLIERLNEIKQILGKV